MHLVKGGVTKKRYKFGENSQAGRGRKEITISIGQNSKLKEGLNFSKCLNHNLSPIQNREQ